MTGRLMTQQAWQVGQAVLSSPDDHGGVAGPDGEQVG